MPVVGGQSIIWSERTVDQTNGKVIENERDYQISKKAAAASYLSAWIIFLLASSPFR